MIRIFIMYNLNNGISLDDYKKWSSEIDRKIVMSQPGILSFDVHTIKGGLGKQPYQIVEIIEADSWEDWLKALETPEMIEGHKQWQRYCDEASLVVLYGEKL